MKNQLEQRISKTKNSNKSLLIKKAPKLTRFLLIKFKFNNIKMLPMKKLKKTINLSKYKNNQVTIFHASTFMIALKISSKKTSN